MRSWPAGCYDPDSCARHERCMYIKCRHENDAALKESIRYRKYVEDCNRMNDKGEIHRIDK
jgi:hypothetical protein